MCDQKLIILVKFFNAINKQYGFDKVLEGCAIMPLVIIRPLKAIITSAQEFNPIPM